MHVGCAETKPSVRCLRKWQRFAIRLRHGLRFLNWITNGSYRVTISSITIARRNSEQRRREKRATFDICVAGDGSSGLSARFLPPTYDRCDRSRSMISRRKPHPFYLSYLPGAGSWHFHVRIRPRFRFIRDWFYEWLRRDVVVWYIGIAVVILVLALPSVINIRYRYSSYFTS